MRRKDREVTECVKVQDIIERCTCCRIAFNDISIMKHNTGKSDWSFTETMMDAVTVFKLEVDEMSCKEHQ